MLIKNQTKTFVPYTYDAAASVVLYSASTSAAVSNVPITISTINVASIHGGVWATQVTSTATFTQSTNVRSTSFYLNNGQSVVWNNSYCTVTVPSRVIDMLSISDSNPLNVSVLEEV